MPNAYYWWQGGREGGQKSQKPAYVIHGCSLEDIFHVSNQVSWILAIRFRSQVETKITTLFTLAKLRNFLKMMHFFTQNEQHFNQGHSDWQNSSFSDAKSNTVVIIVSAQCPTILILMGQSQRKIWPLLP